MEGVERRRMGWFGKVVREDREIQRKERWKMINKSQYNRWYKGIKGEGIPEYLRKGWGKSRWRRVARYRLEKEMRESRKKEEKRRCRLYGTVRESWEHVWEECREQRLEGDRWQEAVGWVLGEEEVGDEWMREIEEERRIREGEGTGRKVEEREERLER